MRKALILAAFLVGCSATGPKFSGFVEPPIAKAVVYVYRPMALAGSAAAVTLSLNGEPAGDIKNGGYRVFEVLPGSTVLNASWQGLYPITIQAYTAAGTRYYARYGIGIGAPTIATPSFAMVTTNFNFAFVPESIAAKEMADVRASD